MVGTTSLEIICLSAQCEQPTMNHTLRLTIGLGADSIINRIYVPRHQREETIRLVDKKVQITPEEGHHPHSGEGPRHLGANGWIREALRDYLKKKRLRGWRQANVSYVGKPDILAATAPRNDL
jgi:hypothetical protein